MQPTESEDSAEILERAQRVMSERGWGSESLMEAVFEVLGKTRHEALEIEERARRLMAERGWGPEKLWEAAAKVMRPRHFQWREALFPRSVVSIAIPTYSAANATAGGKIYNIAVRSLNTISAILSVLVFIPSLIVGLVLGLVGSPLGLFQYVVSPAIYERLDRAVVFVGTLPIWLITSPVKLCNLLTATIVFFFGPKN